MQGIFWFIHGRGPSSSVIGQGAVDEQVYHDWAGIFIWVAVDVDGLEVPNLKEGMYSMFASSGLSKIESI